MKPFRNIPDAIKNRIATRKWVVILLRKLLTRLRFSVEGMDIFEGQEGEIHLRVKASGSGTGDFPFKVSAGGNGIVVSPGRFRISGNADPQIWILGTNIQKPPNATNWTQPSLFVPTGLSEVILEVLYYPQFGSVNVAGVPVSFITGATIPGSLDIKIARFSPTDVASNIDYAGGTATEGKAYIRLAQVNSTSSGSVTVVQQDWQSNIAAACQGDGKLFLAVG